MKKQIVLWDECGVEDSYPELFSPIFSTVSHERNQKEVARGSFAEKDLFSCANARPGYRNPIFNKKIYQGCPALILAQISSKPISACPPKTDPQVMLE
jgi:hypothetical protein